MRVWVRVWEKLWGVILVAIVATGAFAIVYMIRQGGGSLPVTGQISNFTATDINGQTVSLANLNGKIRLFTWFYTHCPDQCPLTAYRMEQIQNQLEKSGQFGSRVVFVSMTLDPVRDTLPVIRQWANQFHANFQDWYFLRATPAQTARILKAYGVGRKQVQNSSVIEHVIKTILIDQNGNIRATYPLANLNTDQVLSNIRNLISKENW